MFAAGMWKIGLLSMFKMVDANQPFLFISATLERCSLLEFQERRKF